MTTTTTTRNDQDVDDRDHQVALKNNSGDPAEHQDTIAPVLVLARRPKCFLEAISMPKEGYRM